MYARTEAVTDSIVRIQADTFLPMRASRQELAQRLEEWRYGQDSTGQNNRRNGPTRTLVDVSCTPPRPLPCLFLFPECQP